MKQEIYNLIHQFVDELGKIGQNEELQESTRHSFIRFMHQEILRSDLRTSTRANHLSTVGHLTRFKSNLTFEDLTYTFLCEFEHYLLNEGLHCNTVAKHMKHLKRYLNLAINMDLYDLRQYPFRKYRIKQQTTRRSHLTPEELQRLEKIQLSTATARRTRDVFLFSCYTGLRFSDLVRITPDNFQRIDGKLWLVYSSVKTRMNIRLPLFLLFNGKSIGIYDHYARRGDKTLFGIAPSENSNMNKRLKIICQQASIKPVTFHAARHTHATLLLYRGASITTVQKLLGHRSVRTTEIYSTIMDMTVIRDLERIRE